MTMRIGRERLKLHLLLSNFYQLIFDFLDRTCNRGEPGSTTVRLYFTVDRMRGTIDRKMLECTGQDKVL